MSKIAVIYWSGTGNTQAMAEAVAAGAKEAGAEADLLTCADVSDISAYDAAAGTGRKESRAVRLLRLGRR